MSIQPLHNEKQILSAIAEGDAASFGQLYEHYRRKVFFIAWRMLQSENEAEDVQQEIFTKLWIHRVNLPDIEQFNSYLNTMIRNHVYNSLRKKMHAEAYIQETLKMLSPGDAEDGFQISETNELKRLLQVAINSLPTQQKKIFQLVRMEGRKHAEVAELLGISKSTVKKHTMEAQKNITAFFEGPDKTALLIIFLLILY